MLDAGSRAFLADFGVSKPMKELSKVYTKNAAGTYLYMPPEKLRPRCGANRRISFAADIWSFGVTVLQLLCSDFDAPYGPGMDVPDIVFMLHMDKEAPRVPAVPDAPELQHTLQACLSLDHNERPSAAQLVQTLQRISNHLGAATQPSVTAAQGSSQDARAAAAARRRLAEEAQERQEMVRRVKCAEQKKAAAATKTQQKQQQQQQQQQQQALHPLQLLGSPSCGTTLTGHSDRVSSVAYTPDGSTLVSGSWDKTIKLWNVASGKCSATLEEHSDRVNSVAISQDGRLMASGSHDKTFKLWDLGRRKFTATLFRSTDLKDMVRRGGIISMDGVAISPDGASLASCTLRGDSEDSTIGLWDTRSGNQKAELWKLGVRQKNVAFSSDGVLLASCGHRHLTIWDTRSARMIATLPMIVSPGHESTAVTSVVFSPDRAAVLSSRGKTIKVWDAKSWQCLKTLEGHTDGVTSVALTFGGQHAVSGSHDKTIKIWDWRGSGKCLATLEGHCNSVSSVAVSPDGKTLASGSLDKTIKLWRIAQ
ncbi:WD40-repeat-containing domain protein [Dunaliella salina]|uniref:WD40-repeat-containing domain protein n=1 Tax=Dunaliella salina TaxID=3046 RepID=A0ABQ7G6B4_DUNSA|nr:WD40-repeat-containing domain protein [Dunaliella salina]|eukprot:KAF5830148.1 WD40-repeat-containing domain protein [Dunaliella salina]